MTVTGVTTASRRYTTPHCDARPPTQPVCGGGADPLEHLDKPGVASDTVGSTPKKIKIRKTYWLKFFMHDKLRSRSVVVGDVKKVKVKVGFLYSAAYATVSYTHLTLPTILRV